MNFWTAQQLQISENILADYLHNKYVLLVVYTFLHSICNNEGKYWFRIHICIHYYIHKKKNQLSMKYEYTFRVILYSKSCNTFLCSKAVSEHTHAMLSVVVIYRLKVSVTVAQLHFPWENPVFHIIFNAKLPGVFVMLPLNATNKKSFISSSYFENNVHRNSL